MSTFRKELIALINKHSKENESNTPDFILADYLIGCMKAFEKTIKLRTDWYKSSETTKELVKKWEATGLLEGLHPSKRIDTVVFEPEQSSNLLNTISENEPELLNTISENDQKVLNTESTNDQKVLNIDSTLPLADNPIHHKLLLIYDYINRRLDPKNNTEKSRKWVYEKFYDVVGIFNLRNYVIDIRCDESNNSSEVLENEQLVVDIKYRIELTDITYKDLHLIFAKHNI